jgi:hypothetical protein
VQCNVKEDKTSLKNLGHFVLFVKKNLGRTGLGNLCPKDRSVAGTLQPGTERPRTYRTGTFRQGTLQYVASIAATKRIWPAYQHKMIPFVDIDPISAVIQLCYFFSDLVPVPVLLCVRRNYLPSMWQFPVLQCHSTFFK